MPCKDVPLTCKVLGILLMVLAIIVTGSSLARADITGTSQLNFAFNALACTLVPEIKLNTPCEKTVLEVDVESLLNVTWTISGLIFNINAALGITGIEHVILTTRATLGSLDLTDEFWFATPFQSVTDVNLQPNITVIPPARVMFVKKRVSAALKIGGITLSTLAIFEDTTFPSPGAPYGTTSCDGDPAPDGTCVDGVETNPADQYQTQSFRFGTIITLEGQTISGITITSTTSICANEGGVSVKKFAAPGGACTSGQLLFSSEQISLAGIQISKGIILGQSLSFQPSNIGGPSPFLATTSVTLPPLLGFMTFSGSFSMPSPTMGSGSFGESIALNAGDLHLSIGFNDLLQFSSASAAITKSFSSSGTQSIFFGNAGLTAGVGLSSLAFGLSVIRGSFSTSHNVSFVQDPIIKGVSFASYSMNLSLSVAPGILKFSATFGRAGLAGAGIGAGLVF